VELPCDRIQDGQRKEAQRSDRKDNRKYPSTPDLILRLLKVSRFKRSRIDSDRELPRFGNSRNVEMSSIIN